MEKQSKDQKLNKCSKDDTNIKKQQSHSKPKDKLEENQVFPPKKKQLENPIVASNYLDGSSTNESFIVVNPSLQEQESKKSKSSSKSIQGQQKHRDQSPSEQSEKSIQSGKPSGVCKLFKAGKCFYGDKCKFVHGKVKVPLDKICKQFNDMGKCKFDAKCHFVHMTREEWEEKYRTNKKPIAKQQQQHQQNLDNEFSKLMLPNKDHSDSLSNEDSDSNDEFEYKSKTSLKKEKQKRLETEHKEHKIHLAKQKESNARAAGTQQKSAKTSVDITHQQTEVQQHENTGQNHLQLHEAEVSTLATQEKEALWFDEAMIDKMNVQQQMQQLKPNEQYKVIESDRKCKPWVDFSRTEEGKALAIKNNTDLFNNDYVGYVRSLKEKNQMNLAQLQRSYMSSFTWIDTNRVFEIKHNPTCKKETIPINFDISEGHLAIRIYLGDESQPEAQRTKYEIINSSIPSEISNALNKILSNIHASQQNSAFKTLKYFDCNMERVFKSAFDYIQKQKADFEAIKQQQELEALLKAEAAFKAEVDEKDKLLKQVQKSIENNDEEDEREEKDDDDDENCQDNNEQDPYFNQNDSQDSGEDNDEIAEEDHEEESKDEDPTLDLDLNMHCYLKDIQMRGVAHLRVTSLLVQVQCKSCKYVSQLTLTNLMERTNENILINNLICVSCNRIAVIHASRPFVCNSETNLAFRIGSFTWHVLDIQSVSYEVSCMNCGITKPIEKYVSGSTHNSNCYACFSNMNFVYFGFTIEKKIDQEYLNRIKNKKANGQKGPSGTSTSMRPKKIGTYKQGEPLPKNGACSHYRYSYRLFRFPCCGKAYQCDICHDQNEKGHDQLLAKAMICGFCSREQTIKQECSGCKKLLVRLSSNSGFWEGGKGTRNQAAMSKGDNHKFSGLSKTISRKKAAKKETKK